MKKVNSKQGIIRTIIIIVIAIAILSYYGINMKNISDFIVSVWNNILVGPVTFVWHLFVQYIWTPFLNSVKTLKK